MSITLSGGCCSVRRAVGGWMSSAIRVCVIASGCHGDSYLVQKPSLSYSRIAWSSSALGAGVVLTSSADPQAPSGVAQHVFNFHPRMGGRQISLAIIAEAQHGFARNHRRRTAARQAHPLPPAAAVAVARTGDVRNPLRQPLPAMFQQHHETLGQGRDIAGATRSRAVASFLWPRAPRSSSGCRNGPLQRPRENPCAHAPIAAGSLLPSMSRHWVAFLRLAGSAMVKISSGEGVLRITPFSNNPTAFGACVFFATTNAISGSRIPTKTISRSRISRAALTTISSPGV